METERMIDGAGNRKGREGNVEKNGKTELTKTSREIFENFLI
jgi:hypothetical protein